jgi:hypothetical protein
MLALTRPSGTRGVVLFESWDTQHEVPLGGSDLRDSWVADWLGLGMHLMTEPFLEFERPWTGWTLRIDLTEGVELRDRSGTRALRTSLPVDPAWFEMVAKQGRCLIVTGTGLLSSASEEWTDWEAIRARIDSARRNGAVVAGIVDVVAAGREPE